MPRITISIPNDLKRRLGDVRVKKALNVSRICQEALRHEVQRLLDLPLDLERMEALIARLRVEHRDQGDRWFELGSQAARDWIEHQAKLEELAQLGGLSMQQRISLLGRQPPSALVATIESSESEPGFHLESLLRGWAATVGLMWAVLAKNM